MNLGMINSINTTIKRYNNRYPHCYSVGVFNVLCVIVENTVDNNEKSVISVEKY